MQQFFQTFTAFIDQEGHIVCQTWNNNQVVGMALEKYKELEKMATDAVAKAEEYKKKLVDSGLLQEPLSTEEQIAALSSTVAGLKAQLNDLSEMKSQMAVIMDALTNPHKEG